MNNTLRIPNFINKIKKSKRQISHNTSISKINLKITSLALICFVFISICPIANTLYIFDFLNQYIINSQDFLTFFTVKVHTIESYAYNYLAIV